MERRKLTNVVFSQVSHIISPCGMYSRGSAVRSILLISFRYCRHEAQLRQALFFSAASIAGAFSGLLAFGISKMDGVGNLAGWRWIFILEGILTVIVAVIAYFTLFDFPETATFLTEEERAFIVYRLKYQGQRKNEVRVAQDDTFQWKFVKAAFLDWQIWVSGSPGPDG